MSKFTNNEMIVAKNISKEYKWMTRDKSGSLCAFAEKPNKDSIFGIWLSVGRMCDMNAFNWMFKSVMWEDKEPTLIRDIYDPQILDDVERKYLTAVLKPLPEVKEIYKATTLTEKFEYLVVCFCYADLMRFPRFTPHRMYKGMELNKRYTPEELGVKL